MATASAGLLALTSAMNPAFAYGITPDVAAPPVPGMTQVMGGSGDPIPHQSYVDAVNGLYIQPNMPGTTPVALFTPEDAYPLLGSDAGGGWQRCSIADDGWPHHLLHDPRRQPPALAAAVTLPAYDVSLFVDQLAAGDLININVVRYPIAADLGLGTLGVGVELFVLLDSAVTTATDLLGLIP